jgi:hypothetical protein
MRVLAGAAVAALAAAVAACQSQTPHGEGPIALQPNVQLAFQRHLDHERPMVFLVAADGSTSYGMYCPYLECEPDPLYILAQKRCEERVRQSCRVFAEYGKIAWRGPVGRVSPGEGVVAGAVVDWGVIGTLHNLKIDGLAAGQGTFSGKIRNAACAGAIDVRALTWRLDCGAGPSGASAHDGLHAQGTLSAAGAGRWRGFGWSADHQQVRLFVAADVALDGPATPAGRAIAFADQPPTYEEPGQMAIKGGDRISFRWRR